MIWPFKRKPKPLNPGPINEDWAVGDLAEVVSWVDWFLVERGPGTIGRDPEAGEVFRVVEVQPIRTRYGDDWYLGLSGLPASLWEAKCFRKVPPLNSEADAEFVVQIKALKPVKQGQPA